MLGDWSWRWHELLHALDQVESAYVRRPGGSAAAQHDVFSFLLWSDVLVDWVALASGLKPRALRVRIEQLDEPWLAVACDLAIVVKHGERDRHLAGDPNLGMPGHVSQSVAVMVPTIEVGVTIGGVSSPRREPQVGTAAHSWGFRYTPRDEQPIVLDGLDLARRVVDQWRVFLPTLGLALPK